MKLDRNVIEQVLGNIGNDLPIYVYNSIDSTNTKAKELSENGYKGNAVIIADSQTAGRGRMGRSFISDGGKGLYLSILLGKESVRGTGITLTTYMAVIAARVIERLSGADVSIKWVNDLYLNGKKLSGILTEGRADPADGSLSYAVCGIGVNLLSQDFDPEVKNIATTLEDETGKQIDVNILAKELIKEFFDNLSLAGTKEISDEYKRRSFLIGKRVNVIKANTTYPAKVIDINDDCELIVKRDNGEAEALYTGEVSLKI